MADIGKIISALNDIAGAAYAQSGPVSSRPTLHRTNFDRLQGSARQVSAILTANPTPSRDSQENIQSLFDSMKENVNHYCLKTSGSEPVLVNWNKASSEWQAFASGY